MKLNLGCGRRPMEGWVNVDSAPLPKVDWQVDFDTNPQGLLDYAGVEPEPVTEFFASHVIEHLRNPLLLMEACHRLATPDARFTILCPHGASDDADEDPTHVRRLYPGSFAYFAAPTYWRADYGYRGDWQPEVITLKVWPHVVSSCRNLDELQHRILHDRNVVAEMEAVLRAVKPARGPTTKAAMVAPRLEVLEVEVE